MQICVAGSKIGPSAQSCVVSVGGGRSGVANSDGKGDDRTHLQELRGKGDTHGSEFLSVGRNEGSMPKLAHNGVVAKSYPEGRLKCRR
jgi:hypothetical protein